MVSNFLVSLRTELSGLTLQYYPGLPKAVLT